MTPKRIGIIGMGLLGRGIAACFLSKGFHVEVHSVGDRWREDTRRDIFYAIQDIIDNDCAVDKLCTEWVDRYRE